MFADPPSRVSPATAYVMLIGVQFLWSSSIILGRYVHADIPPIGLSFWRWTIAALILLPFAWSSLRVNLGLLARSWKIMAGLAFAMGFASTATLVAVNFTTAINANVV
ncbi:MAG: EamA family transporter, partial [Rhodospirillales bacterium]|nr:EamA family transporter [Rhodospirillales bacterium]